MRVRVEGFATFWSALLLVGVGCTSAYAGVYAETVWAVHKEQLLVEGFYGLLCTAGGMVGDWDAVVLSPSFALLLLRMCCELVRCVANQTVPGQACCCCCCCCAVLKHASKRCADVQELSCRVRFINDVIDLCLCVVAPW